MAEKPFRVLVVEARFYADLADELLAGAADALKAFGADYEVISVPGALEIPAVVAMAADAFDGFVALGCVIRGETHHFDIVANESSRGLMDLAVSCKLAIGNGILTVEDGDQAWARARVSEGDKGGGAARACLEMMAVRDRFASGSR